MSNRTHYPLSTVELVLKMVQDGSSYSSITKKTRVPASTISTWKHNHDIPKNRSKQLEHLKRARILAAASKTRIRGQQLREAADRADQTVRSLKINKEVARALLAMLYWAEGTKGGKQAAMLKFVNTDPDLALLYITLLRRSYPVQEKKFRVGLHLAYYHNHADSVAFWSTVLQIPKLQFWKIHVKKRSSRKKYRKNFKGICSIYYGDDKLREEIMCVARGIEKKYCSRS